MKKLLLIIALLSPAFTFAQHKKPLPSTFDLVIGTYTTGASKGIYVYRFYEDKGRVAYLNEIDGVTNPSYVTTSTDNKFLYAVNEGPQGGVSSFTFNGNTGKMVLINKQSTQGADPCHILEDKEQRNLFVANYSSGSLAVFPINKDGSIAPLSQLIQDSGNSVVKDRQQGPHVHNAILTNNEKYLLYTDLGTDKVNIMRYKSSKKPPLTPADQASVSVAPGNGPRHLVFSADNKYLYLVQELGGFINTYSYDNGKLKQLQSLNMLTPEMKGNIGSAAIKISPDGKFLYASNRGSANDIVQYAIDPNNGTLTFASRTSSLGKGPRDFAIDPSGKFLVVANQNSDSIIVYRLDPATGKPGTIVTRLQIGNPVCLKFVPAE
ncbi:MAG: lactonase family protein [Sphingobacteriales bacterium]